MLLAIESGVAYTKVDIAANTGSVAVAYVTFHNSIVYVLAIFEENPTVAIHMSKLGNPVLHLPSPGFTIIIVEKCLLVDRIGIAPLELTTVVNWFAP